MNSLHSDHQTFTYTSNLRQRREEERRRLEEEARLQAEAEDKPRDHESNSRNHSFIHSPIHHLIEAANLNLIAWVCNSSAPSHPHRWVERQLVLSNESIYHP